MSNPQKRNNKPVVIIDRKRACKIDTGALYRVAAFGFHLSDIKAALVSGDIPPLDMTTALIFCGLSEKDREFFGDPQGVANKVKMFNPFLDSALNVIIDGLGEAAASDQKPSNSEQPPQVSESEKPNSKT